MMDAMTPTSRRLHSRRRSTALAILVAGFGSALLIYLTAAPVPGNPLGSRPEDSKQYLRYMELYGGKANIVASGLRQWFESLLHGPRLAMTVACLTLLAALFYLISTTPLSPPDDQPPRQPGPGHEKS